MPLPPFHRYLHTLYVIRMTKSLEGLDSIREEKVVFGHGLIIRLA